MLRVLVGTSRLPSQSEGFFGMSDYVQHRTHGLLKEILGSVDPPNEGGWVFSYGTISLGVSVVGEGEDANVAVFTRVLSNVEKHPELLDCLNDINTDMAFGQIFWSNGSVYIQRHLNGRTIDREELQTALQEVGHWGDSLDEPLAERFGSVAQGLGAAWPPQPVATEGPPGPPPPGAVGAT
jgi:Putative bacterial sensory transduction regulator